MPELCILDTNFLIEALANRVDLDSEFRRVLPGVKLALLSDTVRELEQLATRDKTKTAQTSQLALTYVKQKSWQVVEGSDSHVDASIIELAASRKISHVATLDLALRKRLKELGVVPIVLRQRRYVALS